MQHRFIRGARKTSYLTELIERYQDYRTRAPGRAPQYYQATVRNSGAWDGTMRSEWDFNTVRTTSAMGSLRSMAKDIMPPGMVLDEEYEDEEQLAIVTVVEEFNPDSLIHGSPTHPHDDKGDFVEATPNGKPQSASTSTRKDIKTKIKTSSSKSKDVKYQTSAARKAERQKQRKRKLEKAERAGGKTSRRKGSSRGKK